MIPTRVPPSIDLPSPPPLPPVEDADRSYESIESFVKNTYYEEINPKSLNAPVSYAEPKSQQEKKKKSPFLKQAYMQDKSTIEIAGKLHFGNEAPTPPAIVEERVTDLVQPEATARDPRRQVIALAERRLSRSYSAEQMEKVLEMLQQVMQMEDPAEQQLYDDIASSLPQASEQAWGQDASHYVDMDKIDDTYYSVPDSPKHLYHNVPESPQPFYHNLHAKPPLPPKPNKSASPQLASKVKLAGRKKPGLLPKPDHLSQPVGKQSSFGKGRKCMQNLTQNLPCR